MGDIIVQIDGGKPWELMTIEEQDALLKKWMGEIAFKKFKEEEAEKQNNKIESPSK